MRDSAFTAIWLVVGVAVIVFVGMPVGIVALLHAKREDWYVKVKRLLGALFVAIVIAAAMTQTAEAVKMECADGFWWVCW